jgi:lysophospholipase L1-like esterase
MRKPSRAALAAFIIMTVCIGMARHASADNSHYQIDIGFQNNRTLTTGWNNWTESTNQDSTLSLVDSLGATSTATMSLTDKFFVGNNAACTPAAQGATTNSTYPSSATADQFTVGDFSFLHSSCTDDTAVIKIGGLDPENVYEFRMFSSRYPGTGTNRTAVYTVGSASTTLNADGNENNIATLSGLVPNGSGEISLTVSRHPSANWGYIGILDIIGTPPDAVPEADAGSDVTLTMPDDSVTLEGSGTDSDGTIEEYSWAKIYGGTATLTNASSSDLELSDLYPGEYKFRLTVTDDYGNEDTDDVIVYVHEADEPSTRPAKTIVILGSSSAWGWTLDDQGNAVVSVNSWANLYGRYLDLFNTSNTLVNLGIPGFTTYHVMPDDFVSPDGLPDPDPSYNITKALTHNPDAIIINLPSNDSNALYPIEDIQENFEILAGIAEDEGIPLWVTGSAPRDVSADRREHLVEVRDWIYERFGEKSIDVWTDAANPDGTMNSTYSSGDTVHPNDAGYNLIFQRVAEEGIIEQLYPADISAVDDSVTANTATITWTTNKPVGGVVEYGTASDSLTLSATETATSTTSHSVTLGGLSYDTTYYYKVISEDEVGNAPESSVGSFTIGSAPSTGGSSSGRSGSSVRKPRTESDPVVTVPTPVDRPAPSFDQSVVDKIVKPAGEGASQISLARDLEAGSMGSDVRTLQQILNALGFTIAQSGAGAPGFETDYFGPLTRAALSRYQQAKGIVPAVGYFGPITRASLGL